MEPNHFGSRFLRPENTPGNAGSRAGQTGGRAFGGPGAARLSPSWRRRGLNLRLAFQPAPCPPARSCSRFGCSGFPRRGGGAGSATSGSRLGFLHQCRAAPGGPRRPSLLPGTTFHSHGARGGANALGGGARAPSPPPPSPAPLLGNLPPRPAARGRWRPLPREPRRQRRVQRPLPAPIGAEGWSRALREPPAPSPAPRPLSQPRRGRGAVGEGGRGSWSPHSPPRPWHLCDPVHKPETQTPVVRLQSALQ